MKQPSNGWEMKIEKLRWEKERESSKRKQTHKNNEREEKRTHYAINNLENSC